MQLSSRILTALAVLILAVAVVAVRAGSTGTVEAATGVIDVVNVGTCYTTDTDVFTVDDCEDGDDIDGYNVAERDTITETGTVYATYAHDPKTAPDSPRAVLENSNLLKISIKDVGRDKRTPVLLGAGPSFPCSFAAKPEGEVNDQGTPETTDDTTTFDDRAVTGGAECVTGDGTTAAALTDAANTYYDVHLPEIQKDYPGIAADTNDFRWIQRGTTVADVFNVGAAPNAQKVLTGITINKNTLTTDYKPMFVVVGNNSPITLYGLSGVDANNDGSIDDGVTTKFEKLNKYLAIDEDVGPGRIENESGDDEQEVAPWFSVRVSIPDGTAVRVQYVVYETSEFEVLVGGKSIAQYGDAADTPDFTTSEKVSDDTKLVVEARTDGRVTTQNLQLRETSRFSGQYEGYLQLTDANGTAGGNWGLDNRDGEPCASRSGCASDEAAIAAVESGPVVIAYKDTDGTTQLLDIAIDTVPPAVQIDQPVHEVQIQDLSPEFAGSFSDAGSGIREDSFRAYVDHTDDTAEDGKDEANNLAVDFRVDGSDGTNPYGLVEIVEGSDKVELQADYAGYATNPQFGVINHEDAFNRNGDLESIDGDPHDDGATSGTFGDSVRIDFVVTREDDKYNNTIDFQALVADVAGNIGFSDSDPNGPRFINNFGEEEAKRKTGRYNVLGWYARHIFFLDEVDPEIIEERSVTGFYGENDDGVSQVNRSGILVAFDRAVDADSIDLDTFTVNLDPTGGAGSTGAAAQVVDVDVAGEAVYLLLNEELASDATPMIDIASGEWVADPAGNRLTGGDQASFDLSDGIAPKITVSLSEGSGTGEGDEGPSKLTENLIVVTIEADEDINTTPSLVVVCSNIGWGRDRVAAEPVAENDKGLSDLVNLRSSGARESSSADFGDPQTYDCGSDQLDVDIQQAPSYSRPGLTWEYQWANFSGSKMLQDGNLTVVAYARDRRSYDNLNDGAKRYNWGAGTAEFQYDNTLDHPESTPDDEAVVTEARPFVMLNYKDDKSTVSIEEFKIDGTVQEMQDLGENRFLYWPESLELGSHEVVVKAVDAAGNDRTSEFSFTSAERKNFGLKLIAGWNAVSFPANPMDPMIENVFTDASIDMIAGWDASDPEKPWSIATRMGDEWSTSEEHATLNKVHAQYGYWVHSQGFTTQRVKLVGGISRTDPEVTPPDLVSIPTLAGWNFVGVIDQDGDQTEDHFGEVLMDGTGAVKAGEYLGSNKRAYSWDPVRSKFDIIGDDDDLYIGEGIWVYYGGGIAP